MITKKHVAPAHSVVLLSELGRGEVPGFLDHSLVAATESCIAIGCKSEIDGTTEMILGPIAEV